jgi:hypothetical protein
MTKVLDHVDLRVRDRGAATRFYDPIQTAIGAVKSDGQEYTTWKFALTAN